MGLRGYAARDPLTEFKLEGYNLFLDTTAQVKRGLWGSVCLVWVVAGLGLKGLQALPGHDGAGEMGELLFSKPRELLGCEVAGLGA